MFHNQFKFQGGVVSDTPGLAPSPQPPLLDWPSKTGPSVGTGIVPTPRVFPFSSYLSLSIATMS